MHARYVHAPVSFQYAPIRPSTHINLIYTYYTLLAQLLPLHYICIINLRKLHVLQRVLLVLQFIALHGHDGHYGHLVLSVV